MVTFSYFNIKLQVLLLKLSKLEWEMNMAKSLQNDPPTQSVILATVSGKTQMLYSWKIIYVIAIFLTTYIYKEFE